MLKLRVVFSLYLSDVFKITCYEIKRALLINKGVEHKRFGVIPFDVINV